jgi:uncharacterized phage protein gp47/JayE
MSGLTEQGFSARRLPEIKQDLEQAIQEAIGQQIDFGADTPDGQIVGVVSEARAAIWALAEQVYQSQYPSTASGINLDRAVDLNGITRLPATPTTSNDVVVFGGVGTVLVAGRLAANEQTDEQYRLVQAVTLRLTQAVRLRVEVGTLADNTTYRITIGAVDYSINSGAGASDASVLTALQAALPFTIDTTLDGDLLLLLDNPETISVSSNLAVTEVGNLSEWAAVETGRKLLPAGTLVDIVTPVAGWAGLVNRTDGAAGAERETDAELRLRRAQSIGIAALGTLEAITATLRQQTGVTAVTVRDNTGTVTDSDGIPPQHIWAIVQGGNPQDIARTLFKIRAGGIGLKGDEVVPYFSDVTGVTYDIRYDRPVSKDVFISIDITIDSAIFPNDGTDAIRQALVGKFADIQSGDTLFFSRLYTAINSVQGHYVTDLRLDTNNPPLLSGVNIEAALNERISVAAERITINVTS